MASYLLTGATMMACAAIFVRLFTFQRGSLRFRRGMSCMAWLVMASAAVAVLHIAIGELRIPAEAWPVVVQLTVFALALLRSRGNLAGVLRPDQPEWSGVERRAAVARDE